MSDFLKNYDAITDTQLRSCVKLLGKLLGNAISAHAGKEVYTVVEKLRKGFINLQENKDQKKHDQLINYIEKLDPDILKNVVRSFSKYFALVNVAEEAYQHIHRESILKSGKKSEISIVNFETDKPTDILRFDVISDDNKIVNSLKIISKLNQKLNICIYRDIFSLCYKNLVNLAENKYIPNPIYVKTF